MTRREVLEQAINQCLEELYSNVQPSISWEDFKQECKNYSKLYREWENLARSENTIKSHLEYCGPKPYEFYYLPKNVFKEIADSYVRAYNIDTHQNLLDTIQILKNYCGAPIIDKYIEAHTDEYGNYHPGYRGYDHPDNLKTEIIKIISEYDDTDPMKESDDIINKFFEFLDMAGNFYNWNSDMNTFNMSVYLGPSPCSNKETVIKNWKQYRNKDITIDESIYKEEE